MDKWVVKNSCQERTVVLSGRACRSSCQICKIHEQLAGSWLAALREELEEKYFLAILDQLHKMPFYPKPEYIFRSLAYFDIIETKVVILGQDPYHGERQAVGLSFSVDVGVPVPPSLRNIYKEIDRTIGYKNGIPKDGSLVGWAKQGVLLLNTALTVLPGQAGSHSSIGWHRFTDKIISIVNERTTGTVFLLWGADAAKKKVLLDSKKHLILACAHPSPFSASRGFVGCDHFRMANVYLEKNRKKPIVWTD